MPPTRSFESRSPRTGGARQSVSSSRARLVEKTLGTEEVVVADLLQSFGSAVNRNQVSGRREGFTVTIDAATGYKIAPLPTEPSAPEDDRLQAALQAARERGRLRSTEILDREDMLTAAQFAARLGVSRVTVNARRQRRELLGLDGAKRGFRFPAWQVGDDGKPIEALPKLFELLGDSPWGVYRFLTQRHAALDGATAKDALAQGQTARVLQAAEGLARGDFT
jgi:hypothetical protein